MKSPTEANPPAALLSFVTMTAFLVTVSSFLPLSRQMIELEAFCPRSASAMIVLVNELVKLGNIIVMFLVLVPKHFDLKKVVVI